MTNLIDIVRNTLKENVEQPFSVYSSVKELNILNVPIAKPLLIVVLNGNKELGVNGELVCEMGEFIFLSNSPAIDMRNIPQDKEYFALLIEFEHQDYASLQKGANNNQKHYIGKTTEALDMCLQQFVESSRWAPKQVLTSRKREIINLLCHLGHSDILSLFVNPQLKDRLHGLFIEHKGWELSVQNICDQLAMSESTLRRKLKIEQTSVQEIKDSARLGKALHLLQTTELAIGLVAEECGYQSQSRFTERFKKHFGLTPSELRKTKVTE
ncbi:helix-turn-helix transcriptional regulator [Paraglaciecola sp.]|uniref:helix-turn-helix transcriptional regulator n=1 Tax=Paraglaciecola sp. TaxID=1920173 RepID=UPI003EF1FD05